MLEYLVVVVVITIETFMAVELYIEIYWVLTQCKRVKNIQI